LDTTPKSSPVF